MRERLQTIPNGILTLFTAGRQTELFLESQLLPHRHECFSPLLANDDYDLIDQLAGIKRPPGVPHDGAAIHFEEKLVAACPHPGALAGSNNDGGSHSTALMLLCQFFVFLRHGGFPREPHAAFFIYPQAFDPDFIAQFDDVFSLFDAEVRQFADVNQAIFAGQEFDEGAKLFNRDHSAAIDFADLRFGRHAHDRIARDLHPIRRYREDIHRAVVFDIDFAARFFDEFLDVLASRTNEGAYFFRIDPYRLDARRVFAQFLARSA